jgi:hypothetical protein
MKLLFLSLLISSAWSQTLEYSKAKQLFEDSLANPSRVNETLCSKNWKANSILKKAYSKRIYSNILRFCSQSRDMVTGKLGTSTLPTIQYFYKSTKSWYDLNFESYWYNYNVRSSGFTLYWDKSLKSVSFEIKTRYIARKTRKSYELKKKEAYALKSKVICTTTTEPLSMICRVSAPKKLSELQPIYETYYPVKIETEK